MQAGAKKKASPRVLRPSRRHITAAHTTGRNHHHTGPAIFSLFYDHTVRPSVCRKKPTQHAQQQRLPSLHLVRRQKTRKYLGGDARPDSALVSPPLLPVEAGPLSTAAGRGRTKEEADPAEVRPKTSRGFFAAFETGWRLATVVPGAASVGTAGGKQERQGDMLRVGVCLTQPVEVARL